MGRARTGRLVALAVALGAMSGCSASAHDSSTPGSNGASEVTSASSSPPAATPSSPPTPYDSRDFEPALTLDPPGWLPAEPVLDQTHFLTWVGDGADVDRAVRFMSPVGIYPPRHHPRPGNRTGRVAPVPKNFVRYVLGLRKYGAELSDRRTLMVDGRRTTVMTAGTTESLSGALGCQDDGLTPNDCYGLQPYALIRLAVIEDGETTLLAWARTLPGSPTSDQDLAAFDELLGTVRFR